MDDKIRAPTAPFTVAVELLNDQRRRDDATLSTEYRENWENGKHLSQNQLKRLGWRRKGTEWLKQYHPFFATYEAMEQIETAFYILLQARASLIELYGHYYATLKYDGFGLTDEVAWKATHEVFKFVFAAEALVQAYRHFISRMPESEQQFDVARCRAFHDPELGAFVKKLRNCYGHKMLLRVSPMGKVSYGEKTDVESALEFDKERLFSLRGAWNQAAKRFIARDDDLNVLEIVNSYYGMASSLFQSYGSATGAIHSIGYREIKRCEQAEVAASKITQLSILLQAVGQKGVDPYPYLAEHFTGDELDRIQCFPTHTREQVDFMIGLRDPLGFCDTDFRQKLYAVFGC